MLQIWTSLLGENSSALAQWDPNWKMQEKEPVSWGTLQINTYHWHLKYKFVTFVNDRLITQVFYRNKQQNSEI